MKDSCFYPLCVYTNEGHSTLGRRVDKIYIFLFVMMLVAHEWAINEKTKLSSRGEKKIHQQPILICLAVLRGNLIRIEGPV